MKWEEGEEMIDNPINLLYGLNITTSESRSKVFFKIATYIADDSDVDLEVVLTQSKVYNNGDDTMIKFNLKTYHFDFDGNCYPLT